MQQKNIWMKSKVHEHQIIKRTLRIIIAYKRNYKLTFKTIHLFLSFLYPLFILNYFFLFAGQLNLHIPILFVHRVHFLLPTIVLVSYSDQYILSVEKSFLVDLTKVLLVGKHFLGVCLTILMGGKNSRPIGCFSVKRR